MSNYNIEDKVLIINTNVIYDCVKQYSVNRANTMYYCMLLYYNSESDRFIIKVKTYYASFDISYRWFELGCDGWDRVVKQSKTTDLVGICLMDYRGFIVVKDGVKLLTLYKDSKLLHSFDNIILNSSESVPIIGCIDANLLFN